MIQFKENTRTDGRTEGRMDGRTDRPYFIGPFRLPPGVQKSVKYLHKAMYPCGFGESPIFLENKSSHLKSGEN